MLVTAKFPHTIDFNHMAKLSELTSEGDDISIKDRGPNGWVIYIDFNSGTKANEPMLFYRTVQILVKMQARAETIHPSYCHGRSAPEVKSEAMKFTPSQIALKKLKRL